MKLAHTHLRRFSVALLALLAVVTALAGMAVLAETPAAAIAAPGMAAAIATTPPTPATASTAEPASAPDPVTWLDGPEVVEASTCTATTKCFSGGEILSCSGTFCGQRTGCYVFCNTTGLVECPPSRFCP